MAGHSKWANIKRKKEANDSVRAKIFAKLSRQITMAVHEGGGMPDPEFNVKLRLAIEKAKQSNMPKDNIQRAVEKGSGAEGANLKTVQYEGFGPGGVALIINGSTDNSNRTAAEVRNMLDRNGGKLGSQGSVGYLFEQVGYINFDAQLYSEEELLGFADKINAIDFEEDGRVMHIYFPFDKLGEVKTYIGNLAPLQGPEETYRALSTINIDKNEEDKLIHLIELLEDLDDIEEVFTNAELSL